MSEVSAGTLYDMNKTIMLQSKPLSPTKAKEGCHEIFEYMRKNAYHHGNFHFMLLCKERSDYTLFSFEKQSPLEVQDSVEQDLYELFENRGELLSVEKNSDGVMEVWIKVDDEEAAAWFLFPYDSGTLVY